MKIGRQWSVAERAQAWCQRYGTHRCEKEFGVRLRSLLLKKEPMVLGEKIEFGLASQPKQLQHVLYRFPHDG